MINLLILCATLMGAIAFSFLNIFKRLIKLEDERQNLYAYIDEIAIQQRAKKEDESVGRIVREMVFKKGK